MQKFFVKSTISFLITIIAFLILTPQSGHAQTETISGSINITGGELEFTNTPNDVDFGTFDLGDGYTQTKTSSFGSFAINDARGTGDGYNVTIKADPFSSDISDQSLRVTSTYSGNFTRSTGNIIDSSQTLLNAPANDTSMGETTFDFPDNSLSLAVDLTTARAINYETTITFTLGQTPTP